MKWHIIFPLLVAIPAVILAGPFNEDNDEGELVEFERERRIPYMLPQNFFGMRRYMSPSYAQEDAATQDEDSMKRKRRNLYIDPESGDLQALRDFLSELREADEGDDGNDDDLDFDRKRRSPFLYPRGFGNRMDLRRPFAKRGIPYYFPIFHYKQHFPRQLRGMKRFFAKKRSLVDAFTKDDLGSFGYDKRAERKRSENGSDEDDSKRKKKSL